MNAFIRSGAPTPTMIVASVIRNTWIKSMAVLERKAIVTMERVKNKIVDVWQSSGYATVFKHTYVYQTIAELIANEFIKQTTITVRELLVENLKV